MKVGIVGGGTMGLVLAWRLTKAGVPVTVIEAAPQLGGLATWFDFGDFTWDKFYHVIPRSDDYLLDLFRQLRIEDRMQWRTTRTGFLWNNRLISMSNYKEFLTFPALSLPQKLRLAAGLMKCQKMDDPGDLESIRAEEWLIRIFGRQVYEAMWEPLLNSKYGSLKGETPATIMWATIRRYCSTRSRGNGAESLGFLSGGLRTFYTAIEKEIKTGGGEIITGAPVQSIHNLPGGEVAVQTPQQLFRFERVISTLPTELLKRIVPDGEGLWNGDEPAPRFLGVICLALVCRKPLGPYYVTNLIQKGFSFTGLIGVSNLTGLEELNGHHLVMLPRYDVPESEWFSKPDQEIAREFIDELRGVWPDIDQNVEGWFVNRERRVQALWVTPPPTSVTHRCNSDQSIWSINAEIAGRDTLNNNAIVRTANTAADLFLQSMTQGAMARKMED